MVMIMIKIPPSRSVNVPPCFLKQYMNDPETLQSPLHSCAPKHRPLTVCHHVTGTHMEINTYQFHALLIVTGECLLTSVRSSGSTLASLELKSYYRSADMSDKTLAAGSPDVLQHRCWDYRQR
jgi:hypothetical protein